MLQLMLLMGLMAQTNEPELTDVFVGGVDGYRSYRIPSVIVGPKGTLLAFCEGRKFSSRDQSPTDVVLKRSRNARWWNWPMDACC